MRRWLKRAPHGPKLSRRAFLRSVGLAAGAGAVAAGCDTRHVELATTETPTATPLPLVDQYPQVPYTPTQPPPAGVWQVLTPHEARTVEALTARILPGAPDDPGAREAGVVYYIDNMLAFNEGYNEATYRQPPFAQVYDDYASPTPAPSPTPTLTPPPPAAQAQTAQPFSETEVLRSAPTGQPTGQLQGDGDQTLWIPASQIARYGYQSILSPREVYRIGVAAVDRYTQGKYQKDFVELSEEQQDEVVGAMADNQIEQFDKNLTAESFFHNLRRHTAEGMFSDPVYGGNRNMVGWKLVGYPGAQRAYAPEEFQREGTARQPQSIAMMHSFNPGEPANDHVIMPVSGSAPEHMPMNR